MGTNYYRIKKVSEERRQELHKKLDDLLENKVSEWDFEQMIEDFKQEHEVHICKSSFGWQILFDHNWGKYYKPNRKSLEEFLSEEGTHIEDEYGDKITYDEFWDMVKKHNDNPKNIFTSKTYKEYDNYNSSFSSRYCIEDFNRCKIIFGIDSHGETDFEVDGLRFAVFSNFS